MREVLGDVVVEFDVLPNMARCLSMLGIAREVAALTGAKVKEPNPLPKVKEPDPLPKAKEKMKVGVDKTGPAPFKLILPPDVAGTVVVPPLPTGYGLRTEIPTVKKAGDFAESRDPR